MDGWPSHPPMGGPPGFPHGPHGAAPPMPWPGGFFGPPSSAAPKVKKGDVRAAALALLAEGPRNGYQIIQEIAERSHGIWRPSPGSGEGRAHVTEHGEDLAEPWTAVVESVSEELVDLRSLFGQVGMALRQVIEAGTPTQLGGAGKVLADTRRSLYRLLAEDPQEDA